MGFSGRPGGIRAARAISNPGRYRGHEVVGPPPPASSGVRIAQMLNLISPHDVAGLGFGTVEGLHLVAEALRVGFEDRRAASGAPDFIDVPVAKLNFRFVRGREPGAAARSGATRPGHQRLSGRGHHAYHRGGRGRQRGLSHAHDQRHLRGAVHHGAGDRDHPEQLHDEFRPTSRAGAVGGAGQAGADLNGADDDPEGREAEVGLPGGLRIFPSAFQAILNLIDHGMTQQQAIEAPRI